MSKLLKALFGRPAVPPAPAEPPPPALDDPRLDPLRRSCWVPKVESRDGEPHASKFSGTAALAAGESWPLCPNCTLPMQLFLQLNSAELPDGFKAPWGEGIFQFFYCTTSDPHCESECAAWEPFARSTLLRIVPSAAVTERARLPRTAFPAKRIVGWEHQDDLPGWEELGDLAFSEEDGEEIGNSGYPREGDKLAGWPYWVQGVEYPQCPECESKMKLLFQIDSEKNVPYSR
jgi:hypothetical protein